MKRILTYEAFNESLVGFHEDVAKKLAKVLNKETTYSLEDIQKEIPKSGGVATLHSDDSKIVADKLKAMGFNIEGLDEAIYDEEIKKGDDVIENPDTEGFGFKGKTGKVKSVSNKGDFKSYVVVFGKEEQEYHDNEILKK